MYLPEALRCMTTVSLRLQWFRNEEGGKDPDEEEEEGHTHTPM